MNTDNLAIWDKLGRTNPEHTKKFKRGGGFQGTAIKPIYTDHKMTETFGPCGDGWGYSEPTFQMVPGSDGQVAVYCWLAVWYKKADGTRSEPIHGVGGDFVVKKFSSGLSTDDEAFKKAFTDAIGNAMKHLGMSADVHMGRFDDSKYVAALQREEAEKAKAQKPANDQPAFDEADQAAMLFIASLKEIIRTHQDAGELAAWWKSDEQKQARRDFQLNDAEIADLKNNLLARIEALTPQAEAAQ